MIRVHTQWAEKDWEDSCRGLFQCSIPIFV